MSRATTSRVNDAVEIAWSLERTYHDLPKGASSEYIVHLILLFLAGRRGLRQHLL